MRRLVYKSIFRSLWNNLKYDLFWRWWRWHTRRGWYKMGPHWGRKA